MVFKGRTLGERPPRGKVKLRRGREQHPALRASPVRGQPVRRSQKKRLRRTGFWGRRTPGEGALSSQEQIKNYI